MGGAHMMKHTKSNKNKIKQNPKRQSIRRSPGVYISEYDYSFVVPPMDVNHEGIVIKSVCVPYDVPKKI